MTDIFESTDVIRAIAFATKAHDEQQRKYTGEPYINHPIEVARIVSTVPHTTEMIIAAVLHDTVEDTDTTIEDVSKAFGSEVATLVADLTDISRPEDGNRAVRKAIDKEHTHKASPSAKTIKLADLISNTVAITQHDPNFARVYLKEKEELLKGMSDGDTVLYAKAVQLLAESKKTLEPIWFKQEV